MERRLRIGELAQRTQVSTDVLRAWERRYGLLEPQRSEGGYRLYGAEDERRVAAMVRQVGAGVPASEAARLVLDGADLPNGEPIVVEPSWLGSVTVELRAALDGFDEARAQGAFDELLSRLSFETAAEEVLLPYLRELGDRWQQGEASIAQEHFASMVLRGRLLSLARGWDRGVGPRALLACAPGERHELGLIVFGLALRDLGWRITYLGTDTPIDSLAATATELAPAVTVLVALAPDELTPLRSKLKQLAAETRLLLGGGAATAKFAAAINAELLPGDPLEAAAWLTASATAR